MTLGLEGKFTTDDELLSLYKNARYAYSNENVESMMLGLNPSPDDVCLTVTGSFDQPAYLLTSGAKVYTTDFSVPQLNFSKEKGRLMMESSDAYIDSVIYDQIAQNNEKDAKHHIDIFSKDILEKVSKNRNNLVMMPPMNLFDIVESEELPEKLDCLYLSNILTFSYKRDDPRTAQYLRKLGDVMNDCGRVLVTYNYMLPDNFDTNMNASGLYFDEESTKRAIVKDNFDWFPVVYKKKNLEKVN